MHSHHSFLICSLVLIFTHPVPDWSQVSPRPSADARGNSWSATTAASEGCWSTSGPAWSRASTCRPPSTRPRVSSTQANSAGSRLAPRARWGKYRGDLDTCRSWAAFVTVLHYCTLCLHWQYRSQAVLDQLLNICSSLRCFPVEWGYFEFILLN